MGAQGAVACEVITADLAFVRLLTRMDPHVSHQVVLPLELDAAHLALVALLLRCYTFSIEVVNGLLMHGQVPFPKEEVTAQLALKLFLLVALHVAVVVASPLKTHTTNVTNEAAMVCVNPHVFLKRAL